MTATPLCEVCGAAVLATPTDPAGARYRCSTCASVRGTSPAVRPATYRDSQRAAWWERASYYSWAARKGYAMRDPLTGNAIAWQHDINARRVGRVGYIAMAREAFAVARTFGPLPLP